jgi:hypothetical protein
MKSVPLIVQNTVEFTASLPFSQHSRSPAVIEELICRVGNEEQP